VIIISSIYIPVNRTENLIIRSSLYDVSKQFNTLNNWKNWDLNFNDSTNVTGIEFQDQTAKTASNIIYQLHYINPASISVVITNNHLTTQSFITASPFKNDSVSYIKWTTKTTIFNWVKDAISKTYNSQVDLHPLKLFMEDDKRKYGFQIHLIPVIDTLILTTETETRPDDIMQDIHILHVHLKRFIDVNKLSADKKYFYVTVLKSEQNKLKLGVGIPVNKEEGTAPGIKFLKLPANGRLVTGFYDGKYAGKEKIYTAMNQYITDKALKKVAQPLEQYNIRDSLLTDTSGVKMHLFYPVY
jgi:hypothetical protein